MSDFYKVTTLPQLNIGKKKSGGVGGGKNGLTGKLVGITDEDLQLSDGITAINFNFIDDGSLNSNLSSTLQGMKLNKFK